MRNLWGVQPTGRGHEALIGPNLGLVEWEALRESQPVRSVSNEHRTIRMTGTQSDRTVAVGE